MNFEPTDGLPLLHQRCTPGRYSARERERRYVIGDENASNDYFEVYNRAIELFDKRREDTYHYLPCEVVHAAALDLLAWCEKVGEANLAVLIVEATVAFAPDRAKDVIPGVYAVLTRTKYVPNHDKLVARAFTALEPHLVAGAEPCADTVPLIVMSLQSCLSYRGKANEKEIVTDREAGYFTEHEPAMEFTALNDSRILRHLEILAQHPGALCQQTVSSALRSILNSSSLDREVRSQGPSINLALRVLSLALQADVHPDDRTCELMAKTLFRHDYNSIGQQLFTYLRHRDYLCGLSSYKVLMNHMVRHTSDMELDFDAIIDIIDHVHTLETSQKQHAATQDKISRLLAEYIMLLIIREGIETDDRVAHMLRRYTNTDIL